MGSADVVPGVSGGTMALILGIYQRLIDAIKSVDLQVFRSVLKLQLREVFKRVHWFFLVVLLSGVFSAIIFFTRVIRLPELMFTNPEPIYGLFFGLIVGSVWLITKDLGKLTLAHVMWIVLGVAIGLRIVTLVPTETPENSLFVFFSGSLAITAMILPGISGSFILLILRKYDYILMQFGKLGGPETLDAILVLVPFALGMVVGIMLFSRVLSWLLSKYNVRTLCVLIGFMIGSLYVIWPFQERIYAESVRPEIVSVNDPVVLRLMEEPESTRNPEYRRLGEIQDVTVPLSEQMIELEVVKQKLVRSEPFIPSFSNADEDSRLGQGADSVRVSLLMMMVGLVLVIVMGHIAGQKKQ